MRRIVVAITPMGRNVYTLLEQKLCVFIQAILNIGRTGLVGADMNYKPWHDYLHPQFELTEYAPAFR